MPHPESAAGRPSLRLPSQPPDPALAEFLELRLALARIALDDAPERLEVAREALRVVGRNANHAVRTADVRRFDELFSDVCFAARAHIAEARQSLATARVEYRELIRARRRLYRGLALVAEVLTATTYSRARAGKFEKNVSHHGHGVLFAEFVTQVVAATRANPKDIAWVLDVADAELGIAAAHPCYSELPADQRNTLSGLRAEMAAWAGGTRHGDSGYSLLNRLILHVDCMNH